MRRLKHIWFDFYYGTKNLIKWLPIIWRNRDWDYYYLMVMLSKKLQDMSDLHYHHGNTKNADEIALKLSAASNLADRIAHADYGDEAKKSKGYNYLDSENKLKMDFVDTDKEDVKKLVLPNMTEEDYKNLRETIDLEEELMQRDKEALFNIMNKNLFDWWD